MFDRRLKVILVLWLLPVAAMTVRLLQLQVARAEFYRQEAQQMLELPTKYFPCLRGDITDRNGVLLAADAPSWDICVRYGTIEKDVPDEAGNPPDHPIDPCWQAISRYSGVPVEELLERAGRIRRQVMRIHENVSARRGVETPVREERMAHPVVRGLSHEEQVEANLLLADYPAVEVQASHVRAYSGGKAVGHLLGRCVEVDAEAIRTDPLADDDLAGYRLGDVHGVAGAEALGEVVLRGRRGRVKNDRAGQPLSEPVEPVNGQTFRLTIDHALQEALYKRLLAAVEDTTFRTGGCAVLIHIPTRQILAMVDYPSVDPGATPRERAELYKDAARQPLLFRAVREYYPPGSTVKPMILAAAMAEGLVGAQTTYTCYNRLFQEYPDRWRCTGTHGMIGPVAAIQHSCNVFFFHAAERAGVERLVDWISRFGLGAAQTGLPEELHGRLPEPTASRGIARNLGIGQGPFDVTPLQAANMVATLAAGQYRPASLCLDHPSPSPATDLGVDASIWRIVREGMFETVNRQGGTAYGQDRGTLGDSEYVLMGKTGSAEVSRGRTIERKYFCHLPDGRVQEIVAPDQDSALALADCPPRDRSRVKVAGYRSYTRYPPDADEPYTHAWFTGYLAPGNNYLSSICSGDASVAIAVVIEYTGHGGEIAAPVARDMLRSFLLQLRGGTENASAGGGP
ncbi:MAG TPA: penicillin-binding transpeptidase domain-containing protein [Phycisphaerae bacterium]|nr:penicillin-binding transpeptidase domain-containing protein [Phycisphaerae bacterium]